MTNIGKILVVIIFFASVVFMAASAALFYGGINWDGLARSSELYNITPLEGPDKSKYQATHRISGESVASTGILPDVLIKTLKDETATLNNGVKDLKEQFTAVEGKIQKYKKLIEIDQAGIKARTAEIDQDLDKTVQSTKELSQQLIRLTTQANEILREAQNRREDITRLKRQLDEIKTEEFRLEKQKVKLVDLLTRYKEISKSLKRRQQQLMKQVENKVAETI